MIVSAKTRKYLLGASRRSTASSAKSRCKKASSAKSRCKNPKQKASSANGRCKNLLSAKRCSKISTFNVCHLTDNRLTLLAGTLHSSNIHICGLTETRLTGSGSQSVSLPNSDTKFHLFTSGHDTNKNTGVGLLLSPTAKNSLVEWKAITDRIIRARFRSPHARLTVICAYAPTSRYKKHQHDTFYEQLSSEIQATPAHDLLVTLGDFNAHLGTDRTDISRTLGPFTNPAPRNQLGNRVIDLCSQHNLFISNTFFNHKPIHRDTFVARNNNTRHMLDLILVDQPHRTSILDTRVRRKACSIVQSDHELVVCKIRFKFRSYNRTPPQHIDSSALADNKNLQTSFSQHLNEQLPDPKSFKNERPEKIWSDFKEAVQNTAQETLPKKTAPQKHWMTEDLLKLVAEKASKFDTLRNCPPNHPSHAQHRQEYRRIKNKCKSETRKAREHSWEEEAETLEEHMKKRNTRAAFQQLKKFRRPRTRPTENIKAKNGKVISDPKAKLARWQEFYEELLSCEQKLDHNHIDSTINPTHIPDSEPPPTLEEVRVAVQRLKNRKAPGTCQITAEMLKHGGPRLLATLHTLILRVWETEEIPQDWRDPISPSLRQLSRNQSSLHSRQSVRPDSPQPRYRRNGSHSLRNTSRFPPRPRHH